VTSNSAELSARFRGTVIDPLTGRFAYRPFGTIDGHRTGISGDAVQPFNRRGLRTY